MLCLQNARCENFRRIARLNWNGRLSNDGTPIHLLANEVHGATGYPGAFIENTSMRVQPSERG